MPSNNYKYKTVMLIDDNQIDNLINQKMIKATNTAEQVLTHTGAQSALEYLQNVAELGVEPKSVLPEVIFLDIDMPLMDGFQFLKEFNSLPDSIKNTCKIIMLTSSINPQDSSEAKKSEYVKEFVNKPLTKKVLEGLSL